MDSSSSNSSFLLRKTYLNSDVIGDFSTNSIAGSIQVSWFVSVYFIYDQGKRKQNLMLKYVLNKQTKSMCIVSKPFPLIKILDTWMHFIICIWLIERSFCFMWRTLYNFNWDYLERHDIQCWEGERKKKRDNQSNWNKNHLHISINYLEKQQSQQSKKRLCSFCSNISKSPSYMSYIQINITKLFFLYGHVVDELCMNGSFQ